VHIPLIESNYYEFQIPSHYLTLGDHTVTVHKVKDARGCSRRMDEGTGEHVTVAVADMPTILPTEPRVDYCVGERIAFTLAGLPPFAVEYEWNGEIMVAANQPSSFVRVAERPGNFTITGLQDSASDCKVAVDLQRTIHEVPSVRISEGTSVVKGIPQGDQAEIVFRFYGTPPFTFTYTRSAIAKKGQKPKVLESHTRTADDYTYVMFASLEGTYEVTSIEDKYCAYPPNVVRKSV
jgi:nucleoporin POM152